MSLNKSAAAILVAAGQGERLAQYTAGKPKQFVNLGGMPIFIWALTTFVEQANIEHVILTVPEGWQANAQDLIGQHLPQATVRDGITVIAGGSSRQQSVCIALEALARFKRVPHNVLIHDAVRPFVTASGINQILAKLEEDDAITLAIPVSDSIKRVDKDTIIEDLDRDGLMLMQTPQAAKFHLMLEAHKSAKLKHLVATDDAAIIKSHGVYVNILVGSKLNFKITEPEDMMIAQALIENHRWLPGKVTIPGEGKLISSH